MLFLFLSCLPHISLFLFIRQDGFFFFILLPLLYHHYHGTGEQCTHTHTPHLSHPVIHCPHPSNHPVSIRFHAAAFKLYLYKPGIRRFARREEGIPSNFMISCESIMVFSSWDFKTGAACAANGITPYILNLNFIPGNLGIPLCRQTCLWSRHRRNVIAHSQTVEGELFHRQPYQIAGSSQTIK